MIDSQQETVTVVTLFDGGVVHSTRNSDIVVYPGRVDKFETVIPGRGFVRVIPESIRTVEQYGGVSIEIGEGLATCTVLDYAWTITNMMWEHLKSGGKKCSAQKLVTVWTSETGVKSSRNGVLDIGLDSPETRGCRSSEGNVDV